uniref:Uncharacterized protein AlNc14C2G354 n=1 Tax=Albugo laibachii Nc14 TaxID=890382 RepID=F0VZL6_9STRA|nr:conserved hypothetical protein [Albugo laibachii Nc14]|eukprot:CCA14246.1 conserved hypothetical protein [Albugo laibachii Nc14]
MISKAETCRGGTYFYIEVDHNCREAQRDANHGRSCPFPAMLSARRSLADFRALRKLLKQSARPKTDLIANTRNTNNLWRSKSARRSSSFLNTQAWAHSAHLELGIEDTKRSLRRSLSHVSSSHSSPFYKTWNLKPQIICRNQPCLCMNLYRIVDLFRLSPHLTLMSRISDVSFDAQIDNIQQFLSIIQHFFRSLPRAALQCLDLDHQCQTLSVFAAFIGFDRRLRSIAIAKSSISLRGWKLDIEHNNHSVSPEKSTSEETPSLDLHRRHSDPIHEDDTSRATIFLSRDIYSNRVSSSDYSLPMLRCIPESDSTSDIDCSETDEECFIVEIRDSYQDEDDMLRLSSSQRHAHTLSDLRPPSRSSTISHPIHTKLATSTNSTNYSLPKLRIRPTLLHKSSTSVETFCDRILEQFGQQVLATEPERRVSYDQIEVSRKWELALYTASFVGHSYAVRFILQRGVNPNCVLASNGHSSLHAASIHGHLDIVSLLLHSSSINLDLSDGIGMTPLMVAVENGRIEVVEKLLLAGADINHISCEGNTALYLAVNNSSISLVQLLLSFRSELDVRAQPSGLTALQVGAQRGNYDICALLLAHGANMSQCNAAQDDVVALALAHGHIEVADLFLCYLSDDSQDNFGLPMTPP